MNCTDACLKPKGRQAHCATCHATFTGPTWFDMHRIGGKCHVIDGLVQRDGLTATPEAHENLARLKKIASGFNEDKE